MSAAVNAPQMTVWDMLNQLVTPRSMLDIEDVVYVRSLDAILRGKISRKWLCGYEDEPRYYGYGIDFDSGSHTVLWDRNVGDTLFSDYNSALEKANEFTYEKLSPQDIQLEDCKSFEYIRKCDNHRLTATIGKYGDCGLYEHEYMCYHFLRIHPNRKKRDEAYQRLLKKIIEESNESVELNTPELDTLYRVNDNVWASRGCAEHNINLMKL